VQLCLEESFPVQQVAHEMGVGQSTLSKCVRLYQAQGEVGLQSKPVRRNRQRPKVAPAVKTEVVELKRRHPDLGVAHGAIAGACTHIGFVLTAISFLGFSYLGRKSMLPPGEVPILSFFFSSQVTFLLTMLTYWSVFHLGLI
jgi:transposase-like protein